MTQAEARRAARLLNARRAKGSPSIVADGVGGGYFPREIWSVFEFPNMRNVEYMLTDEERATIREGVSVNG